MKFLAIVQDSGGSETAAQLAAKFSVANPVIVTGTIAAGSNYLRTYDESPEYVLIDIGQGYQTILEELDELAEYCQQNTKVVMMGIINDLALYRELLQRGIVEYFVKPASVQDIYNAISGARIAQAQAQATAQKPTSSLVGSGKVATFMAAASGDGSTTVAINTAYMLARDFNQPTVILDMDYQYGMVARNLDLVTSNGLREILEQPEGTLDLSFVEKTIVKYSDNLYVISAPKNLRFIPRISAGMIENLLMVLRTKFQHVIVDLPHLWSDWIAGLVGESDKNFLVSQLWLKSAAHASRFLDVAQTVGITAHKTSLVINRSGSKFKEAITPTEFGAACKKKVDYYISNESKTVITAENQGKTAVEMGNSVLNKQYREIAESIFQMSNQ